MFELDLMKYSTFFNEYGELRLHRNQMMYLNLLNGDVDTNSSNSSEGFSVRLGRGGIWGFSSAAEITDAQIKKAFQATEDKYKWLSGKQNKALAPISAIKESGNWLYLPENTAWGTNRKLAYLRELDIYILKKYPELNMRSLTLISSDVEKKVLTAAGSEFHLNRPLYNLVISLTTNKSGDPTSLYDVFGGFGFIEDDLQPVETYFEKIDELYEHLMRKSEGVYPQPGMHDVVMDADLAGILSHEAIGHTTEADLVMKGSVAGDLLGEKVASEQVTLVDIAHTYEGKLCPVPVFMDDEGVLAEDVVIIKDGILQDFMHDRASAQKMNMLPKGNARAHSYFDEPLIRMRNTMIMPGNSKLEDMIAGVDDGYYLIKSSNGQADTTSEFMFGVVQGYEIKQGKLGKALKDTTISGVAFDVLKSVTAISDDYKFNTGTCGKKQNILVGMGGPAVRCRVNIGGKA
ncbi:MAG: TldD/PmbA family protein [Candidatus Cloacimonetes bacterium]|nr:TldD/PmbA family protein [Candidatus Cloacimonadota bacterium]